MTIEQLLRQIEAASSSAHVRTVFGEPVTVGERTVIPVARVRGAWGTGFGEGKQEGKGEEGRAGGGGSLFSARPVAVVEVTPERVRVVPVVDFTRIVLASIVVSAWSVFWGVRAMRGRRLGKADGQPANVSQ